MSHNSNKGDTINQSNTTPVYIDDAMARMLAAGDVCVHGQNAAGEDLLGPTAKGIVRTCCDQLQHALDLADRTARNFTDTEKRALLTCVRKLFQALTSSASSEE